MIHTFITGERALNVEFDRVERENPGREVKTAVEDSTVRRVIRDILSLPPDAKVPGNEEERTLLEKVICLMSFHNRKWLSEIQVAIPYAQLTAKTGPKDATLKSKVPIRSTTKEGVQQLIMSSDIELRNYFLELLAKCTPESEQRAFPHLLSLYNANEDTSDTTDQLSVVKESGAWLALSYCQRLVYKSEFLSRPIRSTAQKRHISDYTLEEIKMIQESNIREMARKVKESEWRLDLLATPPSQDSLLSRLLINAALNRFILENWAFERRTQAVTEILHGFLLEIQQTAPDGILGLVDQYKVSGKIRYVDLASRVLENSLSKHKNAFSDKVLKMLDDQTRAVLASAYLKEYETEREVNRAFRESPEVSSAMTWLVLAWVYLNGKKLPDDSPALHTAASSPVSRRARVTEIGQNMVSLRRMLSSLLLSHHHTLPSAERVLLHSQYVTNVRAIFLRTIVDNFKGAALSQWDSVLISSRSKNEVSDQLSACGLPERPNQSQASGPAGSRPVKT